MTDPSVEEIASRIDFGSAELAQLRAGDELPDGRILGEETVGLDGRDPDSFWTRADPILGPDGRVIRGGMWQPQRDWWSLDNFVRMFVGGFGSGKSLNLCKRAIALALANAPIPVLLVSPTYRMARDTIVETLLLLLEGRCRIDPRLRFTWHKTAFDFTLVWRGSRTARILVRNGENPDRLKGSNVAAGLLDEPFLMEQAVFEQVVARVRHPDAQQLEIALGGTPEELNWGYDLAEGELRKGYDVGLVRADTAENLALPAGYVDRLTSGYSKEMVDAYRRGLFVSVSAGRIYHQFDPSKHCDETLRGIPECCEPFVGMDFNVDPLAIVVGYRSGAHLFFVDERELRDSATFEACAEIRRNWPNVRIVYPDPTGRARKTSSREGSDFRIIEQEGFEIRAPFAPWPRRDRFASVNNLFRENRISIGPGCPKLRKALSQMTHKIESKEQGRKLSHVLDAMGYAVTQQFPVGGRPAFVEQMA